MFNTLIRYFVFSSELCCIQIHEQSRVNAIRNLTCLLQIAAVLGVNIKEKNCVKQLIVFATFSQYFFFFPRSLHGEIK